jgi:methionine-rich copper-binding protein CopC
MWKKYKLRFLATLVAAFGSAGVYLYPNELKLLETNPEQHEKVWALDHNEIELLFNRPVDAAKSVVIVTDPNGKMVVDELETYKGVLLQVKISSPYKPHGFIPGTYEVRWIVQAENGMKADGTFHWHMQDSGHSHGNPAAKPHH